MKLDEQELEKARKVVAVKDAAVALGRMVHELFREQGEYEVATMLVTRGKFEFWLHRERVSPNEEKISEASQKPETH